MKINFPQLKRLSMAITSLLLILGLSAFVGNNKVSAKNTNEYKVKEKRNGNRNSVVIKKGNVMFIKVWKESDDPDVFRDVFNDLGMYDTPVSKNKLEIYFGERK